MMVAPWDENMMSPLHNCLVQSKDMEECGRMFNNRKKEMNAKVYRD